MRSTSSSSADTFVAGAALAATLLTATLTGQSPSWTLVTATGPSPRFAHSMAFDAARGKAVLFGGFNTSTSLADTWEWNGTTWQPMVWAIGPSARAYHAMASDTIRSRIVLFGGTSTGLVGYADTWEWNGIAWTQASTTGPSGRYYHGMAFDSLRGRTVLFGGNGNGPFFGDTWEWDGAFWMQASNNGPSPRDRIGMSFDSRRARTTIFGGNGSSGMLSDTWEWNGIAWTQLATSGPSARYTPQLAYDHASGRTILFSGSQQLADTWQWNGGSWNQIVAGGPAGRFFHATTFDSLRGRMLLFGGTSGNGAYGDTWEFDLGSASAATAFGLGCGTPPLSLDAVPSTPPVIGANSQVSLANIPSSIAFMAIGWSNTSNGAFSLPLSLAWYGMPGCELLQSSEFAAVPLVPGGASTATYTLALPNWSTLLGLRIYLQGWANAPGANAANVVVSNGIEWVLGSS